jgi:hypothetical protein
VSAIHKLINSIWNKEELPDQQKESIIVPQHNISEDAILHSHRRENLKSYIFLYQFKKSAIKLPVTINTGYHCYQLHTTFYRTSFSQD